MKRQSKSLIEKKKSMPFCLTRKFSKNLVVLCDRTFEDHLGVPAELSHLSDFAAQCVAAMKSDSDNLISELGLSRDRKTWTIEEKESYASTAFQRGTEALISACKGERKFPGECGEAKEYWEKVEAIYLTAHPQKIFPKLLDDDREARYDILYKPKKNKSFKKYVTRITTAISRSFNPSFRWRKQ